MKKHLSTYILLALATSALLSCKPKLTAPDPGKGSIDVSHYVAIGNSITSGYADGALYYNGQKVSYAALLAEQFKLVGGGDFKIPYVPASSIGVGSGGAAPFKLGYSTDCLGATSLVPVPVAASGDVSIFSSSVYASEGPFNNMGVPGAKVITAVAPGYGNPANGPGNYNPFFTRMASNPATASMLSDAAAQSPTFFSLFIGNNDVLAYALAGGASDAITPSAGPAGVGFDASFNAMVSTMTANGAKGVVGNIPDITSLPYFTTIPYNGLNLNAAQAAQLNGATGGIFNFQVGPNPFIISDPASPIGSRKMTANELVLLDVPLDSIKCHYMGSLSPIPNKYILTVTEISNIQTATSAYNATIKSVAQSKGLAFVDVNAFLNTTKGGIVYDGVTLNTQFVKGGAFSLDGVHLNPIGQALLANEFIKAINSTYGSSIPQVDATKYRGVIFP